MTTPTSLLHLTLTSGHVRESPRREVGNDIVALLRPIVAAGRGVVHGLNITIERSRPGGAAFNLGWSSDPTAPDVRCLLCWDPRAHAAWWDEARALTAWLRVALPAEPAGWPWLAVALQPTALSRTPIQLHMLGDAERCVAWALLDAPA